MIDFDALGLGLAYGRVELRRVDRRWCDVAAQLAVDAAAALGGLAIAVEHVGSTTVPGLLAKPVLDLAAGVDDDADIEMIVQELASCGWLYRGDGRDRGGHVFVLETRPWHRVAHLHVVRHDGEQWRRYLALRELLRADASARIRYEATKVELARRFQGDNAAGAYTDGKGQVIGELLDFSTDIDGRTSTTRTSGASD
jgi:GrpB-like predicted nucleotidyltransferase (UPF0157 family)